VVLQATPTNKKGFGEPSTPPTPKGRSITTMIIVAAGRQVSYFNGPNNNITTIELRINITIQRFSDTISRLFFCYTTNNM
jgi:hypothetical protein